MLGEGCSVLRNFGEKGLRFGDGKARFAREKAHFAGPGQLSSQGRHGSCAQQAMSTINIPALYQIETFSSGFGQRPFRQETKAGPAKSAARPRKEPDFLVQLMTSDDPAFTTVLGRRDVAVRRDAAYAFAAAHKTSARPATPSLIDRA